MKKIIRNQTNLIILAHEIYGINEHMEFCCERFAQAGFDVVCPNLLKTTKTFSYSEEEEAYNYFYANCQFESIAADVNELTAIYKSSYEKIFIVGFSVGATAAWLSSTIKDINGAVGFYGSKIRDYIEVEPNCPVLLFFPEKEQSFDVHFLMNQLAVNKVELFQMSGKHGFCDPYSKNYREDSAKTAWSLTLAFFHDI